MIRLRGNRKPKGCNQTGTASECLHRWSGRPATNCPEERYAVAVLSARLPSNLSVARHPSLIGVCWRTPTLWSLDIGDQLSLYAAGGREPQKLCQGRAIDGAVPFGRQLTDQSTGKRIRCASV